MGQQLHAKRSKVSQFDLQLFAESLISMQAVHVNLCLQSICCAGFYFSHCKQVCERSLLSYLFLIM